MWNILWDSLNLITFNHIADGAGKILEIIDKIDNPPEKETVNKNPDAKDPVSIFDMEFIYVIINIFIVRNQT